MALQQINWLQIDTTNVPSGSHIDLGAIDGELHAVYAENLFISGVPLAQYVNSAGFDGINVYTASLKAAIQTTGSNVTVLGDLLVLGTTTAVNSNVVDLGTNIINLNGSLNSYGGLKVADPTAPNTISGSLLWDASRDMWIAGQVGHEQPIVLKPELTAFSASVSASLNYLQQEIAATDIWQQTGSFYAATTDLQMTGSVIIKGDLRVEGQTTLVQTLDPNIESLVVSGAMNIVKNRINTQVVSASLAVQGTKFLEQISTNTVVDLGGF
jgi:hypothetical protein